MLDRRRAPRIRSLKSARIDFNPHWPPIDCVVRNLSNLGACIEMDGEFNTSIEFDLTFQSAQEKRACRQVWRQDNRLGVEFR
jgi:hypothetical protein